MLLRIEHMLFLFFHLYFRKNFYSKNIYEYSKRIDILIRFFIIHFEFKRNKKNKTK